jgi:hypothetical protein
MSCMHISTTVLSLCLVSRWRSGIACFKLGPIRGRPAAARVQVFPLHQGYRDRCGQLGQANGNGNGRLGVFLLYCAKCHSCHRYRYRHGLQALDRVESVKVDCDILGDTARFDECPKAKA